MMFNRYSITVFLIAALISGSDLYAQYESVEIGMTRGAAQSSGSTGDRIAVDNQGGVHFTWMKNIGYSNLRYIYFNYIDSYGNIAHAPDGVQVSLVNGSGFPQLTIAQGNLAGITYHSATDPNVENYVIYAEDVFPGFGIFRYLDPPDMIGYRCYWPKITIDRSEIIHIIATENPPNAGDPQIIGHTFSTDEGSTWSKIAPVDTVKTISAIIVSSPVSENVAIVYSHPVDFDNQRKNDVFFKQVKYEPNYIDYRSQPVNITEYGQNNDSLFAFDQLDAIYDYNDNLHIIWSAFWVTDAGVNPTMFLNHYDLESGTITEMNSITWPPDSTCLIPDENYPICNMSLAVSENFHQLIFATYTMFDESDCSDAGYANGDIYFQGSWDGGQFWQIPINVTNTNSNNCNPGNCHSEVWPSLADSVTEGGFLHLSYIDDRSGGDTVTTNPVYYYKFDPYPVGTFEKGDEVPMKFSFIRAYPNPFNARTTIEFTLAAPADVELTIYDITGARVEIIRKPDLSAGKHSIVWDAEDVASGVYFARMEAGGYSKSIKMVLLK